MYGVTDPAVEEAVRAFVKLHRATRAMQARLEGRLAACCLTLTQLGVLEALLHRGPLTQRELGRKVLTSAGIYGTVISASETEDEVVVKVDDNTRLRMLKSSVVRNMTREEEAAQAAKEQKEQKQAK